MDAEYLDNLYPTALEKACWKGDLEVFLGLYRDGMHVDYVNLLLSIATRYEQKKIVLFLLKRKSVNLKGKKDAFFIAASYGCIPMVKIFLENGVDVNACDDYYNALERACYEGHAHLVDFLIQKKINITKFGSSALENCLSAKRLDIAQVLVDHGVVVCNVRLAFEAMEGNLNNVKFLVENGGDVNANNNRALRRSSFLGKFKVVDYLLQQGADVSAKDYIALRYAVFGYHFQTILVFIKWGSFNKTTLFDAQMFRVAYLNKNFSILDFLIDRKFAIDSLADVEKEFYLNRKKQRIEAVKKIANWWIPICYDMKRESGKRMAEKGWEKLYN